MICHEDPELVSERNGRQYSMFVNLNTLGASVHADMECIFCHEDADVEEFPHVEDLAQVNCGNCHDEAMERFDRGIHGQALKMNALYAPDCKECHGYHYVLHNSDPRSRTYKMNIPVLLCKNVSPALLSG